ncbi:ribonuclease Z [Trypanosoma rangeli]|uniref:ribonuclease Z n=1 Tax=Trypanosoma rangeli TaxID=5698 RepID=A0A3R7MH41_TRYRA|nr:ribonuclease Z [Trypanosoma rangeli]RNF05758.1 ribonuclease Z [Trypanosoma rangeli]|eukprot:RNF05758.1 ribonuclease Z [Trypanosoma rangeli]
MSADYIQLVGTDVPGSYGSCCFSGQVQHEALRCPTQLLTLSETPPQSSEAAPAMNGDGQLLFFNCPEGVQRFSSEANVRLVRTRGFFFTRWAASAVMGMPGLLFTINDAGVRHANFFGPSSHSLSVESGAEAYTQRLPLHAERADVAGVESMLEALRRHYFWYRAISFQQIRAGAVHRQLPTTLPWNYVCEVPLRSLEEAEGGKVCEPPCDASATASPASFFVLALRLSPTSALLGFRVSRRAATSSEETYSYAIVHAPTACFDPQRAKALGVPAGPMYGQLKQGIGVWVDDEQTPPHGTHAVEKPRRFISPHSVKQATVGSRCMYVSLVLDGDDCAEVAAALESLFGRDETTCEGQCEEETTLDTEGKKLRGSELCRFLAQWQPSFLFCDDHHAASEAAPATAPQATERTVVLTHVVHVQQFDFFAPFKTGTAGAAEAHYITSIFADVQRGVREQAIQCFRNDASAGDATTAALIATGTTHHFCAAVQQKFSAFPTALAHRYHLNCIAEAQFPIARSSAAEKELATMKQGPDPIWPYSVKHQLIPAEAADRITDHTNSSASGPATTVASPSLLCPSTKQVKKGGNLRKGDVTGLLRYPTARSAVDMLSAQFRCAVSRAREQMSGVFTPSSSSLTRPQGDHHDCLHGTCGQDDDSNTWHLDGGGALTFLGTGSAVPSKYRNVSGTYLEVMYHARRSTTLCRAVVVLDFGEGNTGQLAMLWGNGSGKVVLRFFNDLAFVFISHAHADHHLGLMSLLELRHRLRVQMAKEEPSCSGALKEPVLVVCPQEVHEFMQDTWGRCAAYRQWLQEEVTYDIIPAERCRADGASAASSVFLPRLNAVCARLSENTVMTSSLGGSRTPPPVWGAEVFPVHHPANAHALLLRFPAPVGAAAESRVFLFSGDTRPSPLLIERCHQFTRCIHHGSEQEKGGDSDGGAHTEGVFLCLHEATFGEGCEEEAVLKCHSTLPEALQVAAAIRAKHIVLNHFSQRYPKLPGLMKSQLDGRDVDVCCRRRKLRMAEPATTLIEQSHSEDAVNLSEEVKQRDIPRLPPRDALSPDARSGSGAARMCFGFDFMRLSFASLESQQTAQLTPLFVQLLEEYESWGVGTTKRLRN